MKNTCLISIVFKNKNVTKCKEYYKSIIRYNYSNSIDFKYKKEIVLTRERINHISKHVAFLPYLSRIFDYINHPDEVLIYKNNPNNTRNIIKNLDDHRRLFITVRFATKDEMFYSSIISARYETK